MRVLQLIDSLRPGGAERMAVSYANAFAKRTEFSFLCCTRVEGQLKSSLSPAVGYLFLQKKSSLDPKAFLRLRRFVKKNGIHIIQAHSSSYFMAVLLKLSLPGLKLVWQDHLGRVPEKKPPPILKTASYFFDGILSVNSFIEGWASKHLSAKKGRHIKNFLPEDKRKGRNPAFLLGDDTFKIICVANLKHPKDHLNLLKAFKILFQKWNSLSLHLIGKIENDRYSEEVKNYLPENNLKDKVFLYGAKEEVASLLREADLGVLSSSSEGLPVALLEYGRAGLPVVCTLVGECSEVIGNFGKLVPSKNPAALAGAMEFYLENEAQRKNDALKFQEKVLREYSEETVMEEVMGYFEGIVGK